MKSENVIGLVSLAAIIGLVIFYLARYPVETGVSKVIMNTNITNVAGNVNAGTGLSLADVARHSTAADCWIVYSGKAYDVTNYLSQHPGGAGWVTPYCGKDATVAFQTKAGQGSHSANALRDLQQLYVGDITTSPEVNGNTSLSVVTNTNAVTIQPTNSAANVVTTSLDMATIAKHNSARDCWIIVSGSVYAVSGYLSSHPGGAGWITPYCGKDATTAYTARGGTGLHSSRASAALAAFRIGAVGGSTSSSVINPANLNAAPVVSSDEDAQGD